MFDLDPAARLGSYMSAPTLYLQCAGLDAGSERVSRVDASSRSHESAGAFLIAPMLALTAEHCVRDRPTVDLRFMRPGRGGAWREIVVAARVFSIHAGCAVLVLEMAVDDVPGLDLVQDPPPAGAAWCSCAWPRGATAPVDLRGRIDEPTPDRGTSTGGPYRGAPLDVGSDPNAFSGSPIVVAGRVCALVAPPPRPTAAQRPSTTVALVPARDLVKAVDAAAADPRWPIETLDLGTDGGRIELDPFALRVRPLGREPFVRLPFARLRKVWPVLIGNGALLTITGTDDVSVTVACTAEEAFAVMACLPAYVDRPKRTLELEPSQPCPEHGRETQPTRVDFEFSREPIGYPPEGAPIEDMLCVRVTAPHGCVDRVARVVAEWESPRFVGSVHAVNLGLWLLIGGVIYALAAGLSRGAVSMIVVATILLAARKVWEHVLGRRLRHAVHHVVGDQLPRVADARGDQLRTVGLSGREPFHCSIRTGIRPLHRLIPGSRAGKLARALCFLILAVNVTNGIRVYGAAIRAGVDPGPAVAAALIHPLQVLFFGVAPALFVYLILSWLSQKLLQRNRLDSVLLWLGLFYVGVTSVLAGRADAIRETVDDVVEADRQRREDRHP